MAVQLPVALRLAGVEAVQEEEAAAVSETPEALAPSGASWSLVPTDSLSSRPRPQAPEELARLLKNAASLQKNIRIMDSYPFFYLQP